MLNRLMRLNAETGAVTFIAASLELALWHLFEQKNFHYIMWVFCETRLAIRAHSLAAFRFLMIGTLYVQNVLAPLLFVTSPHDATGRYASMLMIMLNSRGHGSDKGSESLGLSTSLRQALSREVHITCTTDVVTDREASLSIISARVSVLS